MSKRITLNLLKEFISVQLGSEFKIVTAYSTRFTADQYECGAARLIFGYELANTEHPHTQYIHSYETIGELQKAVNTGQYELKLERGDYWNNWQPCLRSHKILLPYPL